MQHLNRLKSVVASCPEILLDLQIVNFEISIAFSLMDLERGKGIHWELVKNKVCQMVMFFLLLFCLEFNDNK